MWQTINKFLNRHRMVRGMLSYSILWPVGSMIQQSMEGNNFTHYDWNKILRYCLYGTLIQGPALYCWMKVAYRMWPRSDIRSSLAKAFTEQVAFDPFAISLFLYSMSIFEGKTHETAQHEVATKFLPTYQIGFVYWPIVQTINFNLVPVKNQVICVSFFSLIWTSFLAYTKNEATKPKEPRKHRKHVKDAPKTESMMDKMD